MYGRNKLQSHRPPNTTAFLRRFTNQFVSPGPVSSPPSPFLQVQVAFGLVLELQRRQDHIVIQVERAASEVLTTLSPAVDSGT